jgi:lysyl-tRNA synthetase class 1
MAENLMNWADVTAEKVIQEKGDKDSYVVAAGISPSGHIHIGNFREIITSAQVAKALRSRGKKVRFIYSWDDFDAFRKVPKDFPEDFKQYLGMPLCKVPDPHGCHKSYSEHFEKELENVIGQFDWGLEFIYQGNMYQDCKYAEHIKEVLNNKEKITEVLNKHRKEPLAKEWLPIEVFCEKCWKNTTNILEYDGEYELHYECKCNHSNKFDFRKIGNVALLWRVDWPMRWNYEQVDFEPGGKDHSAAGGSYDTAKKIAPALWNFEAPTYRAYEWIAMKGGKQFTSSGGVVTLPEDVMKIYEPDVATYLFAGTQPNKTIEISFDLDTLKIYEDFDKCEKIYFNKEEVTEKESKKQKRIYELSCKTLPKEFGEQITFRHLTTLVQIHEGDIEKATKGINSSRIKTRAQCALNWLESYAPEDFKFAVHTKITKEINEHLDESIKPALKELVEILKNKHTPESLFNEFYELCQKHKIKNSDFFKGAYLAIIGKQKGPRLANFIVTLGQERVAKLLEGIQ